MTKPKSRAWFERKVSELGELLRQMPADRRQAFVDDVLNEPSEPQRDDRLPDGAEADSDDDRQPTGRQSHSGT